MNKTGLLVAITVLFSGACFSAQATPIIDFAGNQFSVLDGKTAATVSDVWGNLDLTFAAFGGQITHNPGLSGGVDGLGIGDDEISNGESLLAEFSTSIRLLKIYITDLFYEGPDDGRYREEGRYRLLTAGVWGPWNPFSAPFYTVENGELSLEFNTIAVVDAIGFAGTALTRDDYSIRGLDVAAVPEPATIRSLDVAAVPEPATMILLGTGLLGIAGLARSGWRGRS